MVARGQLWHYAKGGGRHRVLIISNDEYNNDPRVSPWGLLVTDPGPAVDSDLLIRLHFQVDHARGTVQIPAVVRLDRDALMDPIGFISDITMNAVELGLRQFLILP